MSIVYDPDKPLPYKLTDEDLGIKKVKTVSNEWKGELIETRNILVNFLESQRYSTVDGNRATIDEEAFVRVWLRDLYQGNPGRDEIDISVSEYWVKNVSGSAYSPVDVTRNGKVIYTIPPMIGRLEVIGSKDRKVSFQILNKHMEDNLTRMPHALHNQLNILVDQMFDLNDNSKVISKVNLKYLFVMDEIFTYYGYDSILTPEIMQIKHLYFKDMQPHGTHASGAVQANHHNAVEPYTDDSDLFG